MFIQTGVKDRDAYSRFPRGKIVQKLMGLTQKLREPFFSAFGTPRNIFSWWSFVQSDDLPFIVLL
jgi:hypothetical protein